MQHLEQLRLQIKKANDAYWRDAAPIMSDVAYDKLVENLRQLNPNDPLLSELGHEELGKNKIKHLKPMRSLDKLYTWKGIVSWAESVSRSEDEVFMVSPKYDGCSIELYHGKISTRGKDGIVGNDISHLIGHIGIIFSAEMDPKDHKAELVGMDLDTYLENDDDFYDKGRVVGELLVSHRNFDRLKHNYPELFSKYKTCRNLVAGFANSDYNSEISNLSCGSRCVHIADLVNHRAFEIPVTLRELKAGRNVQAEIMQFINDPNVDYPVDGIVLRLADDEYAESLGVTAHHPRGSMSFKFTSEQVQVTIKNIAWQVGENNITPVAEFDATPLDGVMVKRATMHNVEWMEDNKIHVGSVITIERRGGVIPKVLFAEDDGQPAAVPPQWCPSCGKLLTRKGKFLTCTNEECQGRLVNKIIRGLEVFGLKGVGPALAIKAVTLTGVKNIMEWVATFGYRDDEHLNRLKELSYNKPTEQVKFTNNELSILTQLAEIRTAGVTPDQLLASVCIPKCSTEFVTAIEQECGGIMNLLQIVPCDMMYGHIVNKCKLDAVTNFMVWFELHKEEFIEYTKLFKIVEPAKKPAHIQGVVCFTGTGPMPRKELQALAINSDYQCTENANQCTILVAADPYGNSGKLQKARKAGIKVISYDEFLNMIGV